MFHNEGVYTGPDEPYLFGRLRVSGALIPNIAVTARSPHSMIRMATAGSSRRSRRGCPGRIDAAITSFASASDLASALRRAGAAHGEHEKRTGGQRDENWPDWYSEYMVREQAGEEPPQ